MVKFITLVLILIVSSCHGCSFIKEHFGITQTTKPTEQNEQQYQDQQERKVEPIPVNPQHS